MGGVDKKYKLQCIIEHRGPSVQNGHYVSYLKISDDAWYEANDTSITAKRTQDLPIQPYICIYKETVAPGEIPQQASSNLQSPTDTVLSESKLQSSTDPVLTHRQLEFKQEQLKFQLMRFMYHDRGNLGSQKFTFEQLKNSNNLQQYTEDEIHYFIKHSKLFNEDNEGNIVYVKNKI